MQLIQARVVTDQLQYISDIIKKTNARNKEMQGGVKLPDMRQPIGQMPGSIDLVLEPLASGWKLGLCVQRAQKTDHTQEQCITLKWGAFKNQRWATLSPAHIKELTLKILGTLSVLSKQIIIDDL